MRNEVSQCTFRPTTSSTGCSVTPRAVTPDRARLIFERQLSWRQRLDDESERQRRAKKAQEEREVDELQRRALSSTSSVRSRPPGFSSMCRGGSEEDLGSSSRSNELYERSRRWQRQRDEHVAQMQDEDFLRRTCGQQASHRSGPSRTKATAPPAAAAPQEVAAAPRAPKKPGTEAAREREEVFGHLLSLRHHLSASAVRAAAATTAGGLGRGRGESAGWQRVLRVEGARLQGAGAAPLATAPRAASTGVRSLSAGGGRSQARTNSSAAADEPQVRPDPPRPEPRPEPPQPEARPRSASQPAAQWQPRRGQQTRCQSPPVYRASFKASSGTLRRL